MPIDLATYVRRLHDLQVLEPAGIDFHLERYHNLSGSDDSPHEFGEALIEAGLISRWLHGRLLGRASAPHFDGLTLLDEFGPGDYLALDTSTQHRVRLWSLLRDAPSRFEARLRTQMAARLARITSAYVAPVRSVTYQRVEYLIEEHRQGVQLQSVVDMHGPLAIQRTVRVFRDAARGLAALRDAECLAGVLTPSEVMVTDDSATVSGFALFDWQEPRPPGPPTSAWQRMRTQYLAPEAVFDTALPGAMGLASVYSLGCTLCFALTGAPPFEIEGRTLLQVMMDHQTAAIPEIAPRRPETPAWLAALCQQMLAKRPEQRPPSLEALCQALEQGALVG